jgi:D-alanyl-D-alanine carboxypeptidase/D-alanyl-D-alanine-endopeptidase (penicillin-binding protein 4)
MRMRSWTAVAATVVAMVSSAGTPAVGAGRSVPLVWHLENAEGRALDSEQPDRFINPASVVKLATSFRALATLGTDHRFVTEFGVTIDDSTNGVRDLVVSGGGDPDFHFENAVLVARGLVEAGVGAVPGDLILGSSFWMGWERGSAGRLPEGAQRRAEMARRLMQAWSPGDWTASEKGAWREMASRRGWDPSEPPSIRIGGSLRGDSPPAWRRVVVHRSEPLLVALRRFNVFSNNDIERLDLAVGPPSGLHDFLVRRFGKDAENSSFESSSGLGRNRMSPRLVVQLLRDLRGFLKEKGHSERDLLPLLGCGDSTLRELFPRLRESHEADGMAGKTGTLNTTDGGVSALAGYLPTGTGLVFFVAAPGAGNVLPRARAAEEDWIRKVLARHGPVSPLSCPEPVPTSDRFAEIKPASRPAN